MHPLSVLGLLLTVVGAVAYLVGVSNPYTGRAFSITLVMVGVTLLAIRNTVAGAESS